MPLLRRFVAQGGCAVTRVVALRRSADRSWGERAALVSVPVPPIFASRSWASLRWSATWSRVVRRFIGRSMASVYLPSSISARAGGALASALHVATCWLLRVCASIMRWAKRLGPAAVA